MKIQYLFLIFIAIPAIIMGQAKKPVSTGKTHTIQSALLRGPYLQAASSTSIVIRWRTAALGRSRVRYGVNPADLKQVADQNELVTEHQVTLSGLTPHTKYYYAIGGIKDTLQIGPDNYFYSLPTPGSTGTYRIGIFGDCGTNSIIQRNARDQFLKYLGTNDLDSWLLVGDNAYLDGTDVQYESNFFNVYKDQLLKKYPLFPAPGNHDYHDLEYSASVAQKTHQVAYYQNFTMPVNGESGGVASHNPSYYSYDVGNVHFLSLDSYGIEGKSSRFYDTLSPQVQWIKQDLALNKNKGWVIAYWHHPPYTKGNHDSDRDEELIKTRQNLVPILERYGVDLIICGHSHAYERSRPMYGNYGMSADFDAAKYNTSNSTGLYDGTANSAPYIKNSANDHSIVYVVTGSAGTLEMNRPSFPHKAMYYSNLEIGGASILEVQDNRLDFKWICTDGVIRDHFTMMKNVGKKTTISAKSGDTVKLTASFISDYKWNNGQTTRSIEVKPKAGTTLYKVNDKYGAITDVFEVKASK